MSSVGEELPKEMLRVSELLPLYDAIPTGVFAAFAMRQALKRAAEALGEGDVIKIIRAYAELKEFHA